MKNYTTKIYGASDDLVYACGEEFNSYNDVPTYVRLIDGTYVKIEYDGCWKIDVLEKGAASFEKLFGIPDDEGDRPQVHGDSDAPSYSDVLILTWDQSLEVEAIDNSPLKPTPKKFGVAKKIIETLEGHSGFMGWWDEIGRNDKNEILVEIAKVMEDCK